MIADAPVRTQANGSGHDVGQWGRVRGRSAMSRSVSSAQVVNVADLRLLAKKRLPRVAFDYIDGGADGEVTLRENCRVFDDVALRPRS